MVEGALNAGAWEPMSGILCPPLCWAAENWNDRNKMRTGNAIRFIILILKLQLRIFIFI
jgi:hypothetical protein